MLTAIVDTTRHPISDAAYATACRKQLDADGALVLAGFLTEAAIQRLVAELARQEAAAFYAASTHNVYLTPTDPDRAADHPFNRQVASSKGLIADDQLADGSPLRRVYGDTVFRSFLCDVLAIEGIHPYADSLSSINVHFASHGQELGWHFDNSSFAVTMLLQAPEAGGVFEYVPDVRAGEHGDMAYERVRRVLDGEEQVESLSFVPGDLVLFRGRNALHRVTPTEGSITRILVVFAFNDERGIGLSDSALQTFYGRTS